MMLLDCSRQIAGNVPRRCNGVAVADIDGDGRAELVVAGFASPNAVLKWKDGELVDIADPLLADPTGYALGIAAADVDGDGREELYILNSDCDSGPKDNGDRLFACFGDHWLDLLAQPENRAELNMTAGHSVAVVDRFGTGRYSFLIACDGAPLRLFELSRRGRVTDAAEEAGLDLMANGRGLACAPLLSERLDIVACNEAGPNFLFQNLGDGSFAEVAGERGLADPWPAGRGVVPMDAGDGRLGLLFANWQGPQRLYIQHAAGLFEDIANADLSMPARIGSVIAADFDNDGHQELFFNIHGEANRLFGWRQGDWREIDLGDAAEPKGYGTGAAVADIDGDGRLELLIAHGGAGEQPLSFYRPIPNANHWLRVQPLTPHGAPARGACVRLFASDSRQVRVVCAGSGYLCQMEPVAHFGLGSNPTVDRVEIRWPDGTTVVVDNPPADRVLTVPFPPE